MAKGDNNMPDGITYSNKDVMFKVLSRNYENKSLEVYGLKVPRIKKLLPTNYPAITTTEIHADNPFLLEDNSLLILEYESDSAQKNFLKYNKYVINALEFLDKEGVKVKNVIVAVIYTGDIKESAQEYNVGAVRIQIEQVFLSKFDTNELYNKIKVKIDAGKRLSDDDVMRLIVLPLTQPIKSQKQTLIEDTIELAKKVQDEQQQLFIMAGILTATNKFIDIDYSNQVKEWIKLTKVARLFEEEKIEAVNERDKNVRKQIAKNMIAIGDDISKIMQVTNLTRAEIDEVQISASA